MTKQEAIDLMKQGVKVTHRYFLWDEYIWMLEDHVFDEDEYDHGTVEEFFFPLRMTEGWNDSWYIYNEPINK